MAHRWTVLAVCAMGTAQAYVHRVGFAPLLPTLMPDLGLSYAAAGTLVTAYFWTYTSMQLPVGVLTDRWGPRRTMLTSLLVLAVGAAAFPLSSAYLDALVLRCLVGLGAAGLWLPALRLIAEWFPTEQRGRATGLCSAGGGLGGTAALVLIPLLAARVGWRWSYGLSVVPVLATAALALVLIRPGPHARSDAPTTAPSGTRSLASVLAARRLWPLCGAAFGSYGAFLGLVTWLPAFLVEHEGRGGTAAGLVTALLTGATIVSWPLGGALADRLGRRRAVYLGSQGLGTLACLAFAWLVPGSGLAGAAVAALLTGLALGGTVIPYVIVTELFPGPLTGVAAGVLNTFWLLGGVVAPLAVGRVLDLTASFPAGFLTCAGFAAFALASGALLPETGRQR